MTNVIYSRSLCVSLTSLLLVLPQIADHTIQRILADLVAQRRNERQCLARVVHLCANRSGDEMTHTKANAVV